MLFAIKSDKSKGCTCTVTHYEMQSSIVWNFMTHDSECWKLIFCGYASEF